MITKLNPDVIQDGSITAEKLADGIANDIISSLSTQSTLPSLTDYYIGQNAGGRTETYFKKTLQSIGSVFQHELYDKVYLKDGSDPTFGNITAWQLNLSENSYVTHADGFGLALSVNDCAFLVGEEGGVYYLDDAGNTQTMLHSGNIGNYKLSQFTDDVVAGNYLRTTIYGNYDADTLFNDGFHSGYISHLPSGSPRGMVHTLPYRGGSNNTKPDYASQIFIPRGDDSTSPNDMFFRTSLADSWNGWNKVITDKNIGNYKSGDSANLGGYDISRFLLTTKRDYNSMDLNTIGDKQSIFTEIRTGEVTTSNCPISGYGALLSLKDGNSYAKMQIVSASGSADTYIRCVQGGGSTISANWQRIITDSNIGNYNAGSATKLQTPRSIWGQAFDGTGNITGHLWSDTWRIVTDATFDGAFFQSKNYDGTSNAGNIYLTGWDVNTLESFNVRAKNSYFSNNVIASGLFMNIGKEISPYAPNRAEIALINPNAEPSMLRLGSNGDVKWGIETRGSTDNYAFSIYSWTAATHCLRILNNGNVGIGNTSPVERLDVSGNIKASGNIICSNLVTTGMINQTANNSFIVHNAVSNGDHKMWITDGTGKSISAGSAFASDALNIISDTLLVLVAQYDYDIRVLKGSRTAKVIDSINYSTLLPYKTPVAISNTYSSDPHNVAMADNTLYIVYENEADDHGCTILSFPTNDGSTPLTCGLLYTTYADSTGEFSCPTVIWSYNITPLMEPDATFEMWFTSYDGGTTWYGTHTVYK